ncbi:DNA-(apurinic or apyrimidinic site) lyase [Ranunculus cassubicifolius]
MNKQSSIARSRYFAKRAAIKKNRSSKKSPKISSPKFIPISTTFKQIKRTPILKIPKSETPLTNSQSQTLNWVPLNLPRSELYLPLTFPTGQTFRWRQTGPYQFTGVVKSHLVSLKQLDNGNGDVVFCVHSQNNDEGLGSNVAKEALGDYLNVGISLGEMWEVFSANDERFKELAGCLGGARVLRQDPLECLMQFLCSSNNNIGRITRMVDYISSMGEYLGTVEGFMFYKFPSLERLGAVSEDELRAAGFGYRAKYIVDTVKILKSKPGGGEEWLASFRGQDLKVALQALCTLTGVGPKVAACVALFSLDQHHAIPVDTHVWQIATKYLLPDLANARLTQKLCIRVAEVFVSKFGKYAGWAQTVLFIAELPSQKALLTPASETPKEEKSVKKEEGE